jgi:hypothetical protein
MATAVQLDAEPDNTRIALVLRGSITLAVIQAVFVVIVSIITRLLGGTAEHALTGVVVFVGAMVTIFYPGTLTRPRTIDGIASAAGIRLGAAWIFLLIDAFVLQSFHVYTNRWYQVGGGSFWWYLPVWWLVGTYLSWMGAWILANQSNKTGTTSIPAGVALVTGIAAVCGVVATVAHFPGATWNVPTFDITMLPGLTMANVVRPSGAKRPGPSVRLPAPEPRCTGRWRRRRWRPPPPCRR